MISSRPSTCYDSSPWMLPTSFIFGFSGPSSKTSLEISSTSIDLPCTDWPILYNLVMLGHTCTMFFSACLSAACEPWCLWVILTSFLENDFRRGTSELLPCLMQFLEGMFLHLRNEGHAIPFADRTC